ncbi:MAG: DEAD/DEAH box helicase [Gammaproteobacteria bacterium]|nr:DEAD/DEAH box helicase [Gammaproteobacteria bacterium]
MLFTLADVENQINSAHFEKGVQLFNDHRIKAPNVQRGGELITAIIASPDKPFRVYVRTSKTSNDISINGECSCVQRYNCEHVAAVLLQALKDNHTTPSDILINARPKSPTTAPYKLPSKTSQQVLLYVLQLDTDTTNGVLIQTLVARRLKNGTYGQTNYYDPQRVTHGAPARFLKSVDIDLLSALQKLAYVPGPGYSVLTGPDSTHLLEAMIATERCHYKDSNTPHLRMADPRALHLHWSVDSYGDQHMQWHITPSTNFLLSVLPPCYLDDNTHQCGKLTSDLPTPLVTELLTLPAVPADKTIEMQQTLQQRYPTINIPPLQTFETYKIACIEPIPCLRLTSYERYDVAYLSFDYGGTEVKRHDPERLFDGKQLLHIQRNRAAEKKACQQLLTLGFNADLNSVDETGNDSFSLYGTQETWVDFQLNDIPKLQTQGWRIVRDDEFRYPLAEIQRWYCEANPTQASKNLDDQDWFDIGLGVEIDGKHIDLLPTFVKLLHEYPQGLPVDLTDTQQFIVTLEDKRLLPIVVQRLRPLFNTLLELYENSAFVNNRYIRLNRAQLSRFTALDHAESGATFLEWISSADIRQFTDRLRDLNGIETVGPPAGLNATLRPYQQRGLDWLQFLRKHQLAGILADDMGLGKTIQALAHLLTEKQQGRMNCPCLVIAPTSLMFNWRREAERFTPALKVLTLHGPHRQALFANITDHDLILTTYPLLPRDQQTLLSHNYHVLILDEAQVIKNPKAQATRIVTNINARHRICLTGTPMENHLGELWTLFNFLLPGLLGTSKQFRHFFRTPIEKHGNEKHADILSRRIRPYMLRRTKDQVAAELPLKTEIVQTVTLENEQQELYETVRLAMHRRVQNEIERQGITRSHIVVLDALLKLRQVCCDPRLVKMETAKKVQQSAKLTLLMQLIPEMIEEGRRILVFSQFTAMLDLIEEELKKSSIHYTKLTGQTHNRETPVQHFQDGNVPLFLISLKAGGVGLNLTTADTVIHYDPWWNPAVERQATDRAHRIGQKNPVFVYKFICAGTLEEKIQAMQLRKQALADNLYQNNGSNEPQWTEQDLEQLFEPMGE